MSVLPPLGEKQFRVLKVTNVEPEVECEVVARDLPASKIQSPENAYFALSYAWGEARQSCQIMVNGQSLSITQNLRAALVELHRREEVRDAWHWADQICIDQGNKPEKSGQVRAMHLIYTYAKRTLVWLGAEYDDSDLALKGLDTMLDQMGSPPYPVLDSEKKTIQARLAPPEHPVWRAIVKLYGRAWFQRVWILQEIALSDGAFVLCGARTLMWDRLVQFADAINAIWPSVLMSAGQDPDQQMSGFVSCSQIGRFRTDATARWLFTLLITTRDRCTTKPIDHLFGIAAMLPDMQKPLIRIDYSLPYVDALLAFCKNCIDKDPRLQILAIAPSKGRSEGLPSWCPDLAYAFSDSSHLNLYLKFSAGFLHENQRQSRIKVLTEPANAISVPGFRLDIVKCVAQSSLRNGHDVWESECKQLFESSQSDSNIPDSTLEAYARTLAADHLTPVIQISPDIQAYEVLQAARRYWQECASNTRTDFSTYPRSQEDVLQYEVATRMHTARKFFCTKKGRFGLGPSRVQVGDIVVVFYSGACLWVLRKSLRGDTFTFVGEAYMHGFMELEGTLLRLGEDKNPDEDFVVV